MPFNLLNPWALAIAAAVIPALLVLYFLKLRRREQKIPSTFLWQRAVREMQVNAPFQRLRKNLLLLLQLLVLALALLALARPVVETELAEESSVVMLIDRSASMNARESDGRTRLAHAKEQAERYVRTLNQEAGSWLTMFSPELGNATRVMVVSFGERAEVVAPFTTNTAEVVALIRAIQPSDGRTHLREALELAEAYMTRTRLEENPQSAEEESQLVLFSDGAATGLGDVVPKVGSIKLVPIGATEDNVGITALRIQRNYERPEMLGVFVQAQNFGPEPVRLDITLYVDGRIQTVWDAELSGRPRAGGAAGGGEEPDVFQGSLVAVNTEFPLDQAALIEARIARDDALDADDRAAVLAPAPRRLRALLVSEKNFFLVQILRNLPLERFDYLTPAQYEAAPDAELLSDGRSLWDVVIFDKHASARLPAGNYLFIDAVPEGVAGVARTGAVGPHAMLWWDETHPVLRHVSLDYIYAGRGISVDLPPGAQPLIEGPDGPTLAWFVDSGRYFLLLTFPIEASTFWQRASGPVFFYNAVRFLGAGSAFGEVEPLRPGDDLVIPVAAGGDAVRIERPGGDTVRIPADSEGLARYAGTEQVGTYTVAGAAEGAERYVVNLEDAAESDITPRTDLGFGQGVVVEIGEPIETATPEIWRWFLAAVLVVATVEWYIYNRRVMI